MHPVVNQLVQLQELTLIRDEQRVAGGRKPLEQLDAAIQGMAGDLPADVRVLFEKLKKKDAIVIAPVANGSCAMCGMQLAISHVQAIRQGRAVLSCPNCARMLFYPETPIRRAGAAPRRTEPRKVGIARFSSEALMVPALESDDAAGAIGELARRMEAEGFVDSADRLVEEAVRREAIVSTAVDHGLAFPHVRGVEGAGLALALGLSRRGVRFEEPPAKATRIVFLIAIPTAASAFYLKLLAGLAETFMKAEARKAILDQKTPGELWQVLLKTTRPAIK